MNSYWQDLASSSNGYYEEDDFAAAAYRLVAEQVIYHADLKSRKAFGIIEQYERHITGPWRPGNHRRCRSSADVRLCDPAAS